MKSLFFFALVFALVSCNSKDSSSYSLRYLKTTYRYAMVLQREKILDNSVDTTELSNIKKELKELNNEFISSNSDEIELKNHIDSFLVKYP